MKVIESTAPGFEEIISKGNLYVDKTGYFYNLITGPKMVFFSRPRRFGKSMTVSTLKAIFEGKRELFNGLVIDSKPYDWKVYPVIHIDFLGLGSSVSPTELDILLSDKILAAAEQYEVSIKVPLQRSNVLFSKLIKALASRGEKPVVLIDEYDKVLSDNYFSKNVEELRIVLSDFYEVLKAQFEDIHFAFITGVTKYAKLSVFSKMNNLRDISMVKEFACMCGYTQAE